MAVDGYPTETNSMSTGLDDDDKELVALGYVPSFKREFSNLATVGRVCTTGLVLEYIDYLQYSVNPRRTGICGLVLDPRCLAYPTCGGLYTASAQLTPKKYRARVGWLVGWLNILGQIAGCSSTEFGLSNMIWAAVVVGKDGDYEITTGKVVGLFAALLVLHGILNSLATRWLARLSTTYVFVNLGATFLIIIVLLATTPRSEMHPASYVFGSAGIINQTGLDGHQGWNTGIAFLLGLLSVQWTDYDATAHISEEVKRAAYAVAQPILLLSVIGTGIIGWLFNIVLVLCSGPLDGLPGPSGNAVLTIMTMRMGKTGALILWVRIVDDNVGKGTLHLNHRRSLYVSPPSSWFKRHSKPLLVPFTPSVVTTVSPTEDTLARTPR
ncbi:polyamine transporter tpo5 [Marasmius tenuissimus]|nr:polyamine transporter tpo5 [Marasmius tenuissimus]